MNPHRRPRTARLSRVVRVATACLALGLAASAGGADERPARTPGPASESPWCQIVLPAGVPDGLHAANTWPGGIVPYEFSSNVTALNQGRALDAMAEIEAVCNVTFVPRNGEASYIFMQDAAVNSSCVGMQAGQCTVNMNAWELRFVIVHELMHALGVWHEQQRSDRDQYIELNWPKIWAPGAGNFTVPANSAEHGPYDFDSVMHYARNELSIDGDWTIAARHPYKRFWQRRFGHYDHMSHGDIWGLCHLYGGDPPPGAFALTSPSPGHAVGPGWTPSFTWTESALADDYRLLVDDDGDFGSPEIDVTLQAPMYAGGGSLPPDRLYHWTVVAVNTIGDTRPYPFRTGTFYTGATAPPVLYVDDDAPSGGGGASWAAPMRHLRDALTLAEGSGGFVSEVRVAQGVYTPDYGTGDRTTSFLLVSGVSILGGYAGIGEPDPDERDPALYVSHLSGDLAGDDEGFVNNEENSHAVIYCADADDTAVLDGFVISGGNANGFLFAALGGGILNDEGSPLVRNCVIQGCSAADAAAGMVNMYHGMPRLVDCVIADNRVEPPPGFGAGLLNYHVMTDLAGCQFRGNDAAEGGAVCNIASDSTFTNCFFTSNTAVIGAAMRNYVSVPTAVNCTFSGNTAAVAGGAVSSQDFIILRNSVLWGDAPDELDGPAWVQYSCVAGGYAGTGNVSVDPGFIDPAGGDYRLGPGSGCIDAGDNEEVPAGVVTDLDGNRRFVDDPVTPDTGNGVAPLVDMGAYEFQVPCPTDVNGDGVVDELDLLAVLLAWGQTGGPEDVNRDGLVDVLDLMEVLLAWGVCP